MSTLNTTTSSPRPTLGAGDVGKSYFETDSNKILVWDGSAWNEWNKDLIVSPGFNNNFSGSFDGTDDWVGIGDLTNLNSGTNFTISVWFKRPAARQDMLLGGATPVATGIGMYPWSDGKLYVHLGTNGLLNANLPGENQWINATVTYDSSGSSVLYFNGTQAVTLSSSAVSSTAGNSFRIGNFSGFSQDFLGNIDEVAIWDSTTLDASNVNTIGSGVPINLLSNGGNYNQSSTLTHWYRFGDHASDSGTGGVANGNTITNIENAANPGTNDGSTINGTPSFSTSVPS